VAQNTAKQAGIGTHPQFVSELSTTVKAVAYAATTAVFDDETTEHSSKVAKERAEALVETVQSLSEAMVKSAEQRASVLRMLDDNEARLRRVEKFLRDDVMVSKGSIEDMIPRCHDELDNHRSHLNAIISKAAIEQTDVSKLTGTLKKMARRSRHEV
jgi:dihydroxyacetone kinase-like predicted kinase